MSDQSPRHELTREQFAAIARGGGDRSAIGRLVAGQRSKHRILLAKVAAMARLGNHPDDALAVAALDLLAHLQRLDPAAADAVIGYPSVGVWALHTIRGDQSIAGASPSGLALVAAAAAVRAGLDAEVVVPVVNGMVLLPSLGSAAATGETAIVASRAAEVRSGEGLVRLLPGARGWREVRPAGGGPDGLVVDDVDPFRMPAADGEPSGRLTAPQLAEFGGTLGAAWPLLTAASAAEIAAIVSVIVPYRAQSGHVSTSSPQAFGTVAMSRQPDEYACAETLVHETQHLKLCALLDLVTLTRPDDGQRYYAPWRTDPRPAGGLLQGAYAFLGVSGFWRQQRRAAPGQAVRQRAQTEFARWREGAAMVTRTLLDSGQLTERGQVFVTEMAGVLDEWQREPVPDDALVAARRMAGRHRSQWRADNGLAAGVPVR